MKDPEPQPFAGRFGGYTVLVTGGGSGIGAATAHRFAAEGAFVFVADIQSSAADAVCADVTTAGGQAATLRFDQSNEASVAAAFDETARRGGVDVVCVNAAVTSTEKPIEELDPSIWDEVHNVNLRGAYLSAKAAIPQLRARGGGSIIFTASTAALRAHPLLTAYAASKSGLLALSRSLAIELASDTIRVNCVCPGGVDTPFARHAYGDRAKELGVVGAQANPMGRLADPEDIAAAIAFLASPDARHVNATELVIDGGQHALQG